MAASTSTSNHFDVFISHRGPDTKKTFATPLYRRLLSFKLRAFLDEEEMRQGDYISSQIESAIKNASVQVAIFSPRYANSRWCLNELELMLETRATIIPVFYLVDPSELRSVKGNKGTYAAALEKLGKKTTSDSQTHGEKSRYDSSKIEKWRNALFEVPDISGFVLKACNGDSELVDQNKIVKLIDQNKIVELVGQNKIVELVDKIVECVLKNVKNPLYVADYPTGLDEKVNDFENKIFWAKSQFAGIVGLGGVGKTTLAKELFNRKISDYRKSFFLCDVREKGILLLQKELLKGLFGLDQELDSIAEGITTLQKHLSSNKVLVILDDVDKMDQMKALIPVQTVLHSESLILITSRDKHILTFRVDKSSIYTLTGLSTEHSRELFCWHSSKQRHPLAGFQCLVEMFLKQCDGLPLSLEVFGALVYGEKQAVWNEHLGRLQQTLPDDLKKRLRISYDALGTEDKQIFLDIACFFIRHNRDTAIRIWEGSDWKGYLGFRNLQNKCLVTVDSEDNIHMHDHLRDLGRDIAEESGRCAAETSLPRLLCRWPEEVISDLLKFKGHEIIVRGIKMGLNDYNGDVFGSIPKMMRLHLLDIEADILKAILKRVKLPKLIWLRWKMCPHSFLPSGIPMEDLRVLQVYGSALKTLWQEEEAPLKLRELEISAPLRNIPKSIGRLKELERIVVSRFSPGQVNLTELPEEFCKLRSLKALVLTECSRIRLLPNCFGELTSLQHIDLSFCRNLERLPDSFGNLRNLKYIYLLNCYDLEKLPDSFGSLKNLQRTDLRGCHKLGRLPESFGHLSNLQYINLSDCHGLKRLPDSFGDLKNLQYIDLSSCHNLERLPDSFGHLTNLQHINLSNCHDLETLPDSFDNLKNLQHIDLSRCHNLERLPNSLRNFMKPKYLCLEGCANLTI